MDKAQASNRLRRYVTAFMYFAVIISVAHMFVYQKSRWNPPSVQSNSTETSNTTTIPIGKSELQVYATMRMEPLVREVLKNNTVDSTVHTYELHGVDWVFNLCANYGHLVAAMYFYSQFKVETMDRTKKFKMLGIGALVVFGWIYIASNLAIQKVAVKQQGQIVFEADKTLTFQKFDEFVKENIELFRGKDIPTQNEQQTQTPTNSGIQIDQEGNVYTVDDNQVQTTTRTVKDKKSAKKQQKFVPIINIQNFLGQDGNYLQDCKKVAEALHEYGMLIIKDPRVQPTDNQNFLNMMERYFKDRSQKYYAGQKVDMFPEVYYQFGVTPELKQQAKDHSKVIKQFSEQNQAFSPAQPQFDAKWRYLWRIGQLAQEQKNRKHHHIPDDYPQWQQTMNRWGQHMIKGCFTVAEMAAIGLGLQRHTFTKMMERGPHLLAPTGSDLEKYEQSTVFAGFHYDLNFLTIHGKSRYPGLFAWLRTGQRINVRVPQGHLLLQSGKQFEMLTGGYITCGFHEVIYTDEVEAAKNRAISQGRIPWRVSSTLFSHIRSDVILEPLGRFATEEAKTKYKPISAIDHVLNELKDIKLAV